MTQFYIINEEGQRVNLKRNGLNDFVDENDVQYIIEESARGAISISRINEDFEVSGEFDIHADY